jgi:arginyl-tRNA synthetase
MGIWSKIKGQQTPFRNPNAVGQALAKSIPTSFVVESTSVAGPGFVNIAISNIWIEKKLQQLLNDGVGKWAPTLPVERVVVDFSSPNIAKEMHVGHLRSTIIGDSLSRMLEYCGVDVLRRNHVGDWGTQFGMLIEYLFDEFPNWEEIGEQAIGDLQSFYKKAKIRFDEDPAFKERAQKAVVLLQGGQADYRAAWTKICDVSRREFAQVYNRLDIQVEEKGESFYNPYIADVVKELDEKGLVEESKGARVIEVSGQKIPLILVKSDGGFNYASTDMTALWYRINVEKADWMVYVTDVGQSQHFDMVFKAAQRAGWLPPDGAEGLPKAKHVGFGLVLGTDGKRFRTRSTEVVRLVDLLDEAKERSKQGLIDRGRESEWTAEELEEAAEALGYGAIKYADLKNNRLTNYTFNFDQMLDIRGNTAVYLLYAHARICSIIRKSGKDIEEIKKTGKVQLIHPSERQLGLQLVRFGETVQDASMDLLPNILCEYLYTLSGMFTEFYTNCKVIGSEEEVSRLLICEASAVIMRECFKLLGIRPLYRL